MIVKILHAANRSRLVVVAVPVIFVVVPATNAIVVVDGNVKAVIQHGCSVG